MPFQIKYAGVSLTDTAGGILATVPDDMGSPPIRGTNLVIPFKHGSVAVQKYYDTRVIVLNGYVYGPNRKILWQRIDTLKQLFSVSAHNYKPKKLEFIWPDGTTRYVYAEAANTLGFQGTHTTFSPFSVQFNCADPFWHDDSAAQETAYRLNDPRRLRLGNPALLIADFDSSYDIELVGQAQTFPVPNPGVVDIENAVFKLIFRADGGAFTISCGGTSFRVPPSTDVFHTGDVVVVDCERWTATFNNVDYTGKMTTPLGQRSPLIIPTGNPSVTWTSTTGSNNIRLSIKYSALYL